jgi:hypothetical protein
VVWRVQAWARPAVKKGQGPESQDSGRVRRV